MFSELNYFAANVGAYWGSTLKKCVRWRIGSCMVNNVECNGWNSSQLPEIPGWQGNGIFSWVLNCKFLLVGLVYLSNIVAAYFLMYFGKWSFGLMFVDLCIIVNATVYQNFYFVFIWSPTCFGRHTAHHQEPKTALAASGLAYVEGCWTFSCWTLSSNYTSNNPPHMQNQRPVVQFLAPDDGRCVARNMLSFIWIRNKNFDTLLHLVGFSLWIGHLALEPVVITAHFCW